MMEPGGVPKGRLRMSMIKRLLTGAPIVVLCVRSKKKELGNRQLEGGEGTQKTRSRRSKRRPKKRLLPIPMLPENRTRKETRHVHASSKIATQR